MSEAGRIELPEKLVPVFAGDALFRGAYGGRGSAKTRSFAKMAAVRGLQCARAGESGVIVCGREFQNSLDESSMAEVKAAIESEPWLHENYELGEKYIRTWDGRIDFAFVGLRRNIESVKSTARIRLLWVDEAEPVSEVAWSKAIPTVREEGAEIWVTWNPERRASATNQRFRINPPDASKFAEMNWRDNPWFPSVLDSIRREDEQKRPEQYGHIWEGDYATAHAGAYYASLLSQAQREGRIGKVTKDPLLAVRAYVDIGGTGARSDAFAMWVCQFVGREIRILDYYEAVGQPLGVHLDWLRERGWQKAQIWLPHDGSTHDRVWDVSFESAIQSAGFPVTVIPNQGKGAARARIEAARRILPACWFNESTTSDGRDALGWYHERKSEDVRDVGLGPEHDWCLRADTEIIMPDAIRMVSEMPQQGEVLTLCGWKPYHSPRITRRNAPLVEVGFSDGHTVRCTPEHKFLTESGWISAQHLRNGFKIRSVSIPSPSIGMVDFIGSGQAIPTRRAAAESCIALFGRLRSDLFQKAVISIIATAARSTMLLPIWSAFQPANISATLGGTERAAFLLDSISAKLLGKKPLNGTVPKRVGCGIGDKLLLSNRGENGSGSLAIVFSAASSLMRLFARTLPTRFTAPAPAKRPLIATGSSRSSRPSSIAKRWRNDDMSIGIARSAEPASMRLSLHRGPKFIVARDAIKLRGAHKPENTWLSVVHMKRLSETADVWCLTVPEYHHFALANGVVSHNSSHGADAFGLMCVAYETPAGRPKKLVYSNLGIV